MVYRRESASVSDGRVQAVRGIGVRADHSQLYRALTRAADAAEHQPHGDQREGDHEPEQRRGPLARTPVFLVRVPASAVRVPPSAARTAGRLRRARPDLLPRRHLLTRREPVKSAHHGGQSRVRTGEPVFNQVQDLLLLRVEADR